MLVEANMRNRRSYVTIRFECPKSLLRLVVKTLVKLMPIPGRSVSLVMFVGAGLDLRTGGSLPSNEISRVTG